MLAPITQSSLRSPYQDSKTLCVPKVHTHHIINKTQTENYLRHRLTDWPSSCTHLLVPDTFLLSAMLNEVFSVRLLVFLSPLSLYCPEAASFWIPYLSSGIDRNRWDHHSSALSCSSVCLFRHRGAVLQPYSLLLKSRTSPSLRAK